MLVRPHRTELLWNTVRLAFSMIFQLQKPLRTTTVCISCVINNIAADGMAADTSVAEQPRKITGHNIANEMKALTHIVYVNLMDKLY